MKVFVGSRRASCALLLIGSASMTIAAATRLGSQPVLRIDEKPSCATCDIILTLGPRLGAEEGPGALVAEPSSLASDARGRFYVTTFSTAQPPLVFDRNGAFIQELGRRGPGPGEFLLARYLVVGPGDTVYVTDAQAGRMSVFSPRLEFMRSPSDATVARAASFEVLANGAIVVATDVPTRNRIGFPLHLYGRGLDFVRSFGSDRPSFDPRHPLLARRRLRRSHDGGVWSARATEYVIDRFDPSGGLTLRLERTARWFPPHKGTNLSEDPEPKPRIMAIAEDSLRRLWVLAVVKDEQWRSALGYTLPSRLGGGRSPIPVIVDEDRYFDTVIEVIDVASRSLVSSRRFPEAIAFMIDAEHVATRREDASGAFYIQVWSVSLRDTSSGPTRSQEAK